MPSKSETDRRKALRRAAKQGTRKAEEARMPISLSDLKRLFDHLEAALAGACDHTLRLTRQFLASRQLPEATIAPWLGEYGGFCDCEVLANVEERWGT
nr:putative integron gene cassette protein [uncultured bacterium]